MHVERSSVACVQVLTRPHCGFPHAGLEAATSSSQSEQQQQAQSLQQLASSQHMLQQQLMALTNHVDPAAAAQLAAAAAGDESALTFQPLGPLASGSGSLLSNTLFESLNGGTPGWDEAWATGSYLQCSQAGGRSGSGDRTAAGGPAQHAAGGSAQASAAGSAAAAQHAQEQLLPGASEAAAAGSSGNGGSTPGSRAAAAGRGFVDRMSAVLRHLPVAVRLLRLETAVRDLHSSMAQKAPAGELRVDRVARCLLARLAEAVCVGAEAVSICVCSSGLCCRRGGGAAAAAGRLFGAPC
jgi:hypothetical protein